MNTYKANECSYCRSSINPEQRWVREKIYEPASQLDGEPRYRRYHAEVFSGEQLSCWEKHQLQQEMDRSILHAA